MTYPTLVPETPETRNIYKAPPWHGLPQRSALQRLPPAQWNAHQVRSWGSSLPSVTAGAALLRLLRFAADPPAPSAAALRFALAAAPPVFAVLAVDLPVPAAALRFARS